jgi:hypothetical protein
VLPLLTWLIQGAVGPALVGLPVTWAATDLAEAARRWFRRLRRSDGLSRIVRAAAGDLDLSDAEFATVRRLLENQRTWVEVGRGTIEDLAVRIASCLSGRAGESALAAGRAIAGGLLEFAVRDLEPEWFRQVLFARLDRLQADQARALDQVMLRVHADLAVLLAHQDEADTDRFVRVMGELGRVLEDRLPPGSADQGEVAVYLSRLIRWLNTEPWPQDTRFDGPALTPAAIERKLRVASVRGRREQDLDADDLARRCARLVVLGGPGSGKTWLARRTARLSAEAALEALAAGAGPDEVELPLYTTCARLSAAPPGDVIRRAVVSSALGQLPDLGGTRVIDALRVLFEERNAPTLLVADSLDEARGADDRIRQADTLPPAWRIVLTSRPASWNSQLAISDEDPAQRVGVLQPLRYPGDVEPFIAGWFSARPAWARDLVVQLHNRPALRQAATVPLILAFYCIIGGEQPLPGRRTALYAKVIRRMLTGRWRGGGEHDPAPDACLETLRDWAWFAAASDPVSGVGDWADEVSTPRLRQRSEDDRHALDHVASPLGPADADTGMRQRRFVHRSLREHLVAEYVALRMPAEVTAAELLNHLWYDPDWEYAAPAALAMHPQRDQVLKELICRVTGGDQLRVDLTAVDGCWEIRQFLARVAQESAEGDWSPEAAELIGKARLDLATSRHDHLRQVMVSEWPTSNRLILDSLLRRLADGSSPWMSRQLADVIAGLEAAAEDRAQAREVLLGLLARETSPGITRALADTVARLAVTAGERAQTREALLGLASGRPNPWMALGVAEIVARLDPNPVDLIRARRVLLRLLAGEASPGMTQQLADALARLDPTPDERALARETLLSLLASEVGPSMASELAQVVVRLSVTADAVAQAREVLIGLLAGETSPGMTQQLADTLARLDPTPEERAQAREILLRLLAGGASPGMTQQLADTLARLDPTPEDQAQAREVLLRLLVGGADPLMARQLAETVARLDPTPEEQAQARNALLGLLAGEVSPRTTSQLAETVARLAVTEEDRAQAREVLLRLLVGGADPLKASELAVVVAQLAVTDEDRAQAREVLLQLLTDETDNFTASELADLVVRLDPTPEDRAQAREVLFRLLTGRKGAWLARRLAETVFRLAVTDKDRAQAWGVLLRLLVGGAGPLMASELADVVARLAVTARDRAQAREVLLPPMVAETDPWMARQLAETVARLDPTPEEQAQAREALLGLLAREASPGTARALANAVAQLNPTIVDLGGSRSWAFPPTPALLAAVRQNSAISAWLTALPLLSSSSL